MSTLDALAARAVYAARLLERAVHSPGPWQISWGPFTVPAERVISESGVTFKAQFPDHCYLVPPSARATLLCDGEVVSVREIDFLGDRAFEMEWRITAQVPTAA